ncbi:MAG: sulfotransferase [Caulobacteraceae bacterium]|nr:sulfotransferase [Caulobacteraceae bacterium]
MGLISDIRPGSLDIAELHEQTQAATGLTDLGGAAFAEEDFHKRLALLIQSLEQEAALSPLGRWRTRERLLNILRGRLRFIDDRKRWPKIAEERIVRPVVVLGMARAGSTFLHTLLSQDPANRAPMSWEITFPSPPPEKDTYLVDSRIDISHATLERQGFLEEEMWRIHPFGARIPDETIFIWEYALLGPVGANWNVPSYSASLQRLDFRPVFELEKAFLQNLQHRCPGERWVLKSPAHLSHLAEIFETYPDAAIVVNHRDPAKVLGSLASLFVTLRKRFSDTEVDVRAVAAQVTNMFEKPLMDMIAYRKDPEINRRFFDCLFTEMTADPMAMVRRLYEHLGIELTDAAVSAMTHWLAHDHHGKGPKRSYRLEDYGLTFDDVERGYGAYIDHFNIKRERS